MANELKHKDVGDQMTKTEYHAVDEHVLDSQATGDIIYASSNTQLSRLAHVASRILITSGGIPAWSNTLPAFTLGGTLNVNAQMVTNFAGAFRSVFTGLITLDAGDGTGGGGGRIILHGKNHAADPGKIWIDTPDTAETSFLSRLVIGEGDIAVAAWSNVTHTGIVLSGALDVAGQYLTFLERAAPGAGAANEVRVYAIVGGDTFTDLAAVFQDGSVDLFAGETTPLDSPIFTQPSQTEFKMVMEKPHPGIIKFVAKYPDGKTFTLRELQYHHPDKVNANIGAEEPLPEDWVIEDSQQIANRLAREEAERLAVKEE